MRAHLWVSRRCLISLWQGCSCCTSLNARASSRTDHHKTRRSLQKLLAREQIEFDKLFTQRRGIKSGRFVSFSFLLLLPDHPLTVAKTEPPRLLPFSLSLPYPVTRHVWAGCDHPGRPGICQLQGRMSDRGRLGFKSQQAGYQGLEPGTGGGEVHPQN